MYTGTDFREDTEHILEKTREAGSKEESSDPSLILSTATIPPSLISWLSFHAPKATKLFSPTLHRLPRNIKTRFIRWSGSGNKNADVIAQVRKVFYEEENDTKQIERYATRMVDRARDQGIHVSPEAFMAEAAQASKIIIFTNNPRKAEVLAKALEAKDIRTVALTGNSKRQAGRNGELETFLIKANAKSHTSSQAGTEDVEQDTNEFEPVTKGEPRVLVTTSLLSRGLDFRPSVKHVFLVDEPRDVLDFIHRAGRTGRAGNVGGVTIFGSEGGGVTKIGSRKAFMGLKGATNRGPRRSTFSSGLRGAMRRS